MQNAIPALPSLSASSFGALLGWDIQYAYAIFLVTQFFPRVKTDQPDKKKPLYSRRGTAGIASPEMISRIIIEYCPNQQHANPRSKGGVTCSRQQGVGKRSEGN